MNRPCSPLFQPWLRLGFRVRAERVIESAMLCASGDTGNGNAVSHELSCRSRILFQIGEFLPYCCDISKKESPGTALPPVSPKFEKGRKT